MGDEARKLDHRIDQNERDQLPRRVKPVQDRVGSEPVAANMACSSKDASQIDFYRILTDTHTLGNLAVPQSFMDKACHIGFTIG
jgi:hypothetical protein